MTRPREEDPHGVHIRDVAGGVHQSVIAGRDVRDVTIHASGRTGSDAAPSREDLVGLLQDLRETIEALASDRESLRDLSASAPAVLEAVGTNVSQAREILQGAEVSTEEAAVARADLAEAGSLIETVLQRANAVADTATEVDEAISPLVEKLRPLVEKLVAAALWVGRLWPG